MKATTQFQRWYGCDESDRDHVGDTVASELGIHVRVPEGVVDPVADDDLVVVPQAAISGVYMLRAVCGWPDPRNGTMPYVVAASYVWVMPIDPAEHFLSLTDFEWGLGLRVT